MLVRNQRLIERRVKVAQFRELKAFDDFDFSFNPSIKKKQIYVCSKVMKRIDPALVIVEICVIFA